MIEFFNKTNVGFSHLKTGKPCQDFSVSYHDETRTIVAVCDGHGSDVYIRSDRGSKFACQAIIDAFKSVRSLVLYGKPKEQVLNKIKMDILCRWNALVEQDLEQNHIGKKEIEMLSERDQFRLKNNPAKAYGTTLNGAMILGKYLLCVSLGDGGIFGVKKGVVTPILEETSDETVANYTYSMCSEDAYYHIHVDFYNIRDYDGVFLCTDGIINPYQNLPNFAKSFILPVYTELANGKRENVNDWIVRLGEKTGYGDDVSLAVMFRTEANRRLYQEARYQ